MCEEWKEALQKAFQTYIPVVIGYAGGDHTLMGLLQDPSVKIENIYWCYLEGDEFPSKEIQDVVKQRNGYFVPIGGFDKMMFNLGMKYGYENPGKRLRDEADRRSKKYDDEIEKYTQELEERVKADKNDLDARRSQAYVLWQSGKYEEAVKAYTEIISQNPGFAEAYNYRGNARNALKQYEEAINDYNKAIELDPQYANAYNNRGNTYAERKQYKKAIDDFSKAIELDPQYANAFYNRGRVYTDLNECDKAIENYSKAIELDPQLAAAYNNRGHAYVNLKQYQEAINDFSKAIELDPQNATL